MSNDGTNEAVLMCTADESDDGWVHTLHNNGSGSVSDNADACPVCGESHPDRLCEA